MILKPGRLMGMSYIFKYLVRIYARKNVWLQEIIVVPNNLVEIYPIKLFNYHKQISY